MYNYLYSRPKWFVIAVLAAAILLWTWLASGKRRHWRGANALLLLLTLGFIAFVTLLRRTAGEQSLHLEPFYSLQAAIRQPEMYREMLMNVALFVPLGLTAPNVLPRRWHPVAAVLLTAAAALLLSVGIEWAQYQYALGTAETDDVICNVLGALIGAVHFPVAAAISNDRRNRS